MVEGPRSPRVECALSRYHFRVQKDPGCEPRETQVDIRVTFRHSPRRSYVREIDHMKIKEGQNGGEQGRKKGYF